MDKFDAFRKFLDQNFKVVLGFLLIFLVVVGFFKIQLKGDNVPCDEESLQKACYHVPFKICKNTWDELEIKCNDLLPKLLGRSISPSEIISPKILKCQKLLFDRQFKNSRKMDNGSRCEEHFTYIHERRHDLD